MRAVTELSSSSERACMGAPVEAPALLTNVDRASHGARFHVPNGREGGLSRRGCCGLLVGNNRLEVVGALRMQQSAR